MMDAITLRKEQKKKKPSFLRQDAHRVKRLAKKWRKPRGFQSKIRLSFRGYRRLVKVGFGSPNKAHGLSKQGLEQVVVERLAQLDVLDPKQQAVIVASTVGMRKRSQLIEQATSKGFTILNHKDAKGYLEQLKQAFAQRKENKKERQAKKQSKDKKSADKKQKDHKDTDKDQKQPKQETKGTSTQEENPEEKEKKEKQEKDKILTKKGVGY